MTDTTEDRLAALESRVTALEGDAVESEMSNIRGRIDDLKVQASLAKMDAQDDVKASFDRLDGVWTETRHQLERLAGESKTAGRGVRDGVRTAIGDLRSAFDDAAASLRKRVKD